jgi:hypothetical protein
LAKEFNNKPDKLAFEIKRLEEELSKSIEIKMKK